MDARTEMAVAEKNIAYLNRELMRWRGRLYVAKKRAGLKAVRKPRGLTSSELAGLIASREPSSEATP